MHFPVEDHMVFLTKAGSHSYGTSMPDSDLDVKGVCLPPVRIRLSYIHLYEQTQGDVPALRNKVLPGLEVPWDGAIFALSRAVKLMADNNPNVLEMLWVDDSSVLLSSPIWERFKGIRNEFLSQRCLHTFLGFAHAQMKKILSHRAWLEKPPTKEPTREEFGLPGKKSFLPEGELKSIETAIRQTIASWEVQDLGLSGDDLGFLQEKMEDFQISLMNRHTYLLCNGASLADDPEKTKHLLAAYQVGLPEEVIAGLHLEYNFRMAKRHWQSYMRWKTERSPTRAALEAKVGYDTKHASHLIRLARCCVGIFRDGKLQVMRPDAEDLLEIRRGNRKFESLTEEFQQLELEARTLARSSKIPKYPNHDRIDQELISVLQGV